MNDNESIPLEKKTITLYCPICHSQKQIDSEQISFKTPEEKGIYQGVVKKGDICPHSFSFFIDRNGDVRSCDPFNLQVSRTKQRERSHNWISNRIHSKIKNNNTDSKDSEEFFWKYL